MIATELDQKFYQRELSSFIPDRVFDAHCHLWPQGTTHFQVSPNGSSVGYEQYVSYMEDLHPQRRLASLFLSFGSAQRPHECDTVNEWVALQTAAHADNRGLFFVRPDDDPEWVRDEVKRLGLHGLKCYHTFARVIPTWDASVPDYLPERLVKVADEEGWLITLHLVRARAVADEANIHWIRHFCRTYPNIKLILAHSARGFQPAHNLEGLPKLVGLDNLYFDTSANCEPVAHQAVIRYFGPQKLMYGSDFPISHGRGRHASASDAFLWIEGDSPVWQQRQETIHPVLLGLEHLRSIKWACWSERLGDSEVEDIFWKNAARLVGLE